jgi:diguanylate cyclase (GGDEF)-like protein
VWRLNAVLVGVAAALVPLALAAPSTGIVHRVGLVPLVVLFAGAELLVVHVRFRSDAHTLSMTEIAVVVGLVSATPADLLVAQFVGAALVLVLHRHQPVIKLVFNLAQLVAGVATALLVHHQLAGGAVGSSDRSLVAAAAGATASSAVGHLAVATVMTITRQTRSRLQNLRSNALVLAGSLTATAIGVLAAFVYNTRPAATFLLVAPLAVLAATSRAYVHERERHEQLEFLYRASQTIGGAASLDAGIVDVLADARDVLSAEVAAVLLVSRHHDDRVVLAASTVDGTAISMTGFGRAELGEDWWALAHTAHLLMDRRLVVRSTLAGQPVAQAVVAPITVEHRAAGALLCTRASVSLGQFTQYELRLLETLAQQMGVSMQNGELERSLEQLREVERALAHTATHDPLTGLANRALFDEMVAASLAHDGDAVAVLFIDLDDFKLVNDTHGHAAGDALLAEAADRIALAAADRGLAARIGGDEFAVLVTGAHAEAEARSVADRVTVALAASARIGGAAVGVRASIGVAAARSGMDAGELLHRADVAMYAAKRSGKGVVRGYDAALGDREPADRTLTPARVDDPA